MKTQYVITQFKERRGRQIESEVIEVSEDPQITMDFAIAWLKNKNFAESEIQKVREKLGFEIAGQGIRGIWAMKVSKYLPDGYGIFGLKISKTNIAE